MPSTRIAETIFLRRRSLRRGPSPQCSGRDDPPSVNTLDVAIRGLALASGLAYATNAWAMRPLISADLWRWIEENRTGFEPPVGNKVIWEDSQFTAMVIRGPNRRRDFHDDPSDEIFYMLRGTMTLEYIDDEGTRQNV